MIVADVGLAELILTMLWLFFLFMFIWLFIALLTDLFRDHTLSGWTKAAWLVALVLFPFLGALAYVIVRGEGMAQRSAREQQQARADFDDYIRRTAATPAPPTDDVTRLRELRDSGTITDAEFETMRQRVASGGADAGTGAPSPAM
jgi:hypothetical protein